MMKNTTIRRYAARCVFVLSTALLLAMDSPARAETVYKIFEGRLEVAIPDVYERVRGEPYQPEDVPGAMFIRGGGHAALAAALPNSEFDSSFLDTWFYEDTKAIVRIMLVELISPDIAANRSKEDGLWMSLPQDASAKGVHDQFCKNFSARWGKYSFAIFDAHTEIGRCVNVAGAFVAVFTRKIGNVLIVIDTIDLAEVLVTEKRPLVPDFSDITAAEKWDFYKAAANADVVEKILQSARITRN